MNRIPHLAPIIPAAKFVNTPANSYNLNIIPTQKDNNILTNIRLNYITSGQPGEKLRIQIGFNVFSLNYEEIIGDETIGTISKLTSSSIDLILCSKISLSVF